MKRSLLVILFVIVVAGFVGTLVARDPGYVLISYNGATLQTGLWVFLAILIGGAAIIYYLLRLFRFVGGTAGAIRDWRSDRAKAKAAKLATRGLVFLQQGEFERAERFLEGGARGSDNPAAMYLFAAKAADGQGKRVEREAWLRKAEEADTETRHAVAVASAEMAINHGEFERALSLLENAGTNSTVLDLKQRALLGLGDWSRLADLVPQLKRASGDAGAIRALQKQVALARLSDADLSDDARQDIFKKLDAELKRDSEVLIAWCEHIEGESARENAIRSALKTEWIPSLVVAYGNTGKETLARRIKTAEGWIKQHPDDAALQLCLGQLYEANGDGERARVAYQKSLDLQESAEAARNLGRLLAFDGDYKKSSELLSRALGSARLT